MVMDEPLCVRSKALSTAEQIRAQLRRKPSLVNRAKHPEQPCSLAVSRLSVELPKPGCINGQLCQEKAQPVNRQSFHGAHMLCLPLHGLVRINSSQTHVHLGPRKGRPLHQKVGAGGGSFEPFPKLGPASLWWDSLALPLRTPSTVPPLPWSAQPGKSSMPASHTEARSLGGGRG